MIGILGGMGTQAGLDFCNKLAILNRGKIDQEYPLFILFNKSNIPGRPESIGVHTKDLSNKFIILEGSELYIFGGSSNARELPKYLFNSSFDVATFLPCKLALVEISAEPVFSQKKVINGSEVIRTAKSSLSPASKGDNSSDLGTKYVVGVSVGLANF